TIQYACDLDPETIQVSLAAAYPGTSLYDDAVRNGWFAQSALVSRDGYQDAVLHYPGTSAKEISEGVDRMYPRVYFRPRNMLQIVRGMMTDSHEMVRRLREGKEFLGYLMARRRLAKAQAG